MSVSSIHRAVWDWLKTCPTVTKLSFNYGTEGDHSMIIRPTRSVEETFTGGQRLMAYTVELTIFKPLTFDANDSGNIDMLESVDIISDWVRAQIREGNFPQMPDGYVFSDMTMYENQTEFAIAQDGMFARYVVPFTINYLDRSE